MIFYPVRLVERSRTEINHFIFISPLKLIDPSCKNSRRVNTGFSNFFFLFRPLVRCTKFIKYCKYIIASLSRWTTEHGRFRRSPAPLKCTAVSPGTGLPCRYAISPRILYRSLSFRLFYYYDLITRTYFFLRPHALRSWPEWFEKNKLSCSYFTN